MTMSSFSIARGGDGDLLVDDTRDGFFPCKHTEEEINPYIMVDLGENFNVHSIYVLNRKDCCCEFYFFTLAQVFDCYTLCISIPTHGHLSFRTCSYD